MNQALEAFQETRQDPLVTFNVLSDVHVDGSETAGQNLNLADALQDLAYLNPESAATMFPGDLTNGGAEAQYDQFYSLLDAYAAAAPIPALGNHDVRWLCSSSERNEAGLRIPTCIEGTSPFKERYLSRNAKYMNGAPEGQLYFDQWIDGYHFITLNTEKDLKDQAYLSPEQTGWLARILEGSEPGKPIFLQIHQTFEGTADHEELDWIGGESEERLKAVLENYPQAVIFTGHVHNGKDIIDVHNRTFGHVVDVPCFYYSSYGDSQNRIGYQVSVYDDDIEIRLRDFAADQWLDEYEMHVDLDAVDLIDDSLDLNTASMTIQAGSEHSQSGSEGPAANLLDNNPDTIWHTSYSGTGTTMEERWLELTLNESQWISAVRYLARQTGSNGTILEADILVSGNDGASWTKAAHAKWKGYAGWKSVSFAPVKAGKIRIQPTKTIGEYASGAELRIAGTGLSYMELLQALVDQALTLNAADYEEAGWSVLQAAMSQAAALLSSSADEAECENACNELDAALKALVRVDTIRIASYNIAAGRKPDLEAINAQMAGLNIDLAGLQEIDVNNSRNNFHMLERLSSYGTYPYSMFQKAIDFSGGAYGIGIVSAEEILETNGASYQAKIGENRVWQRVLVPCGEHEIALYNTHLAWENTEIRKAQILELIEAVKADSADYIAITGDFNADQYHEEFYPFIEAGFNLTNGHDGTWHDTYNLFDASMKVYSIDNIITTRNLSLTEMNVAENSLSDHNMIWAEFRFESEMQPSRQLLQFVLQDAKAIENAGYTQASWNRLQRAIAAAENTDGCTQEEIDAIQQELEEAMESLEVHLDTSLLSMAIAYAQAVSEEDLQDVNALVKAQFAQALAHAIAVCEDSHTDQQTVNTAWMQLCQAIHMLEFRSDKTRLLGLIEYAGTLNAQNYDEQAWQTLQDALAQAQETAQSETALNESINAAADALEAALQALSVRELDLSLLVYLCDICSEEDMSRYVQDEAYDIFLAALEQGRQTIASAISQEQVDQAVSALHQAWLNLRLRPDESMLEILRQFVRTADSLNAQAYTKAEWQQICQLKEESISALDNPLLDQKQAESIAARIQQNADLIKKGISMQAGGNAAANAAAKPASVHTAASSHAALYSAVMAAAAVLMIRRRRK